MIRRALTVLGFTAVLAIMPIGGGAAFADGPYSDNPSGYCSDGKVPPGPINVEASTPGPYGSTLGFQHGYDTNRPGQLMFHDSCVLLVAPNFCLPLIGCHGGKIIGEYDSMRVYSGLSPYPCTYETVSHSDHDASVRQPYEYRCYGY